MPIKRFLASAIVATFAAQFGPASAVGLLDAYEAALKNDPTYQSARYENEAGQENRNLGRAGLLPNVAFSYSTSKNRSDVTYIANGKENTTQPQYTSKAANLQLRQTVFNLDALARYKQGIAQSLYSGAVFSTKKQDLVLRLVGAYADAQYAEEQLALSVAQRDAYLEQQSVNQRLFEKGESTKTDVLETQSKYDTAQAQVIEAQDNVTTARNNLAAIVGSDVTGLDPLASDFKIRSLVPASFEEWRAMALTQNPEIESLRYGVEAAYQEINKARAGHAPRLDFTATLSRTDSETLNTLNQDQTNRAVGLQLSVPLYSGGYVNAASRQAVANHERAKSDLAAKTNLILVELRKQYNLNLSSVTRIDALLKAEKSATLLVDATRQSIKGGVRINLDLLNAQQQLFAARRDLAQGRYNYVLSYLRLRGAAGTLGGDDLQEMASYFRPAGK
jgi:protease secretion system outer membrane protein